MANNYDDPVNQGLLGLALKMLEMSGPSPRKSTFGSILGTAGQEGMRQYDQARVIQQRDEELRRRNAVVDMQIKKMQEQVEDENRIQSLLRDPSFFSKQKQAMQVGTDVSSTGPELVTEQVPLDPREQAMKFISSGSPLLAKQGLATLASLQGKKGESRYINAGGGTIFDTESQQFVNNPNAQVKQPNQGVTIEEVRWLNEKKPDGSSARTTKEIEDYWNSKRAPQNVMIGQVPYSIPPGPAQTPRPLSTPQAEQGAAEARARAQAEGRITGERLANADKNIKALERAIGRSELVIKTLDDADKKVGLGTSGIIGAVTKNVPGMPAYDLKSDIKTALANIGFAELQNMRFESPTGGALGQVAIQELEMLQATLGTLDTNQSPKLLKERIAQVKAQFNNSIKNLRKAMEIEKEFVSRSGARQSSGPATDRLPTQEEIDAELNRRLNQR